MRPLSLEIEGLRSFRAAQRIDFTGRDHLAVVGDTGAGKSSILEALTFALYGRLTFRGATNAELVNATAPALRVVLRFTVAGERWEVARTLKRSGKGAIGGAMAVLRRLGDGDEAVEAYEGVREVNAKVAEVLGLDAEAFLRTVVLPQGQFARLLVDDDQRERAAVLRQIWRTDELEAAGEVVEAALAELAPLRGRVEQALATEPDDPDAHLAALRAAAEERAEAAAAAEARREAAQRRHDAEARQALLARLADGLAAWDAGGAAEKARRVAGELDHLDAAVAADGEALDAARARLEAIPDDDGFPYEVVVRAETVLAALPGQLADVAAAEEAAAEADAAMARAERVLDEAIAAGEQAAGALGAAEEQRVAAATAVEQAVAARDEAAARLAAARRAAASVAEHEAAVAESESSLADATTRSSEAAAAAAAARATLDAAVRADAAASAAHGLHAGEPCPVCDRSLPDGWSPPPAADLDAAREAADAAGEAAAAADGERRVLAERAAAARAALDGARATFDEARAALGGDVDLARPDADLLAPAEAAVAEARTALTAAEAQLSERREAATAAATACATAEAEQRAAARDAEAAGARLAEARRRLAAAMEALPEGWRPASADEVAELQAVTAERRLVLEERRAARQGVEKELGQLRRRLDEHEAARRAASAEGRSLLGALVKQRGRVRDACERAGVAVPASLPGDADLDEADLVAAVGAVTEATEAAVADLRAGIGAAEQAAAEAAAAAGGVDVAMAARDAEDARFAARQAAEAAEEFAGRMKAIDAVREAAEWLDALHLALGDLAAALKPGAFPKWLTLRRSRDLLVHASRVLSEMTGGRYAFADLADDSSEWLVVDADNGMARTPASLSGGEKFVASLALALGMVEMTARSGGRLESLFLDEGFGALDRDNLDAALDALASAAASGRMVVTISHVRAVAEQVEHVLSVTREPGGTRVRWLDDAERRALALDDVSGDPALHRLLT